MSEEEIIKEIEIIKEAQDIMEHNLDIYPPKEDIYRLDTKQLKAVICLLDLYNKQQKEIKELKEITKEYDSYIGEKMPLDSKIIIADREYFINGTFVNNFISKDKIRNFAKGLLKKNLIYNTTDFLNGIKELLEE